MEKFGEGVSRGRYVLMRLEHALAVGELEGTDGPHDCWITYSAHPELEAFLEDAILQGALETGGHRVARDPETGLGLWDPGEGPFWGLADLKRFDRSRHRRAMRCRFLAAVWERLPQTLRDEVMREA
ncbi:MAG: hypothetical protein GF355_07085 [Candidatus Eisenbacteria bacterium]|nr:hypothetical protein [Candidatus Eisenbacteria bacterium]